MYLKGTYFFIFAFEAEGVENTMNFDSPCVGVSG